MRRDELGGADHRPDVRSQIGRIETGCAALEAAEGPRAELAGKERGRDAEAVERAALRVAGAHLVGEDTLGAGRPAVVKASVLELRLLEEADIDRGEACRRLGRPAHDREPARDVVGAVAVLRPRLGEEGVLEEAEVVGERLEVREAGSRESQPESTLARAWRRVRPS